MLVLKPSLFHLPGVWTAQGLQNGSLDPVALAARCADAGLAWIAAQHPTPDATVQALRDACRIHGLHFGLWEVLDDKPVPAGIPESFALRPNFWIANVEATPGAKFAPMLHAIRQAHPTLPLGLVTNFGGFGPVETAHGETFPDCAPWIAANVKCIPEAYGPEPNGDQLQPVNMMYEAHKRGWRLAFPVLGCYHDYPFSRYDLSPVDGWSVYLAETMTTADWAAVKARHRVGFIDGDH